MTGTRPHHVENPTDQCDGTTRRAGKIVHFDGSTDDEVLGVCGDSAPLLECAEVEAVCRSVVQKYFGPFSQHKLIYSFSILVPASHIGEVLEMFVRTDPRWKNRPPQSSKLFKIACVAQGRRLRKGERIVKAMFVHQVFRCRLRRCGTGPAAYSSIDIILEKLTG